MNKSSRVNVNTVILLIVCAFLSSIILCGSSKDEEGKVKNEGRTPITDSGLQTHTKNEEGIMKNEGASAGLQSPLNDNMPHVLNEILPAIPSPVLSMKQTDVNNDGSKDVIIATVDNQILHLINQNDGTYVTNYELRITNYENQPNDNVNNVSQKADVPTDAEVPPVKTPELVAVDTADLNADGYEDIIMLYAQSEGAPLKILYGSKSPIAMNSPLASELPPLLGGDAPFVNTQGPSSGGVGTSALPALDIPMSTRLKIVDVNTDSYPDIIIFSRGRNTSDAYGNIKENKQLNYLLINDGAGRFTLPTPNPSAGGESIEGVQGGEGVEGVQEGESFENTPAIDILINDFDNDGVNEMLLINPEGGLLCELRQWPVVIDQWSVASAQWTVVSERLTQESALKINPASIIKTMHESAVANKEIMLDADDDGDMDVITVADGTPVIIYNDPNSKTPQLQNPLTLKPQNSLTPQPLNSSTSYISSFQYKITAPNKKDIANIHQIGDIVYFEFDSRTPAYVWGNILIDFEPLKLRCVSIEENPNGLYNFWVWWVHQTGMPQYGGGGTYYFYDDTGKGSNWAKTWAAHDGQGVDGPTGTYDNALGKIRLYTDTFAGYSYTVPLRLGFEVLEAGPVNFTVHSNDLTEFDWNNVDAGTVSTVNVIQVDQSIITEDIVNNARATISGPSIVDPNQTYVITTLGQIISPLYALGSNVYSYEFYENDVLIYRKGFNWGEENRGAYEFTKSQPGAYVYKYRFRDGTRVHNAFSWIEVSLTVNVAVPGPHIDSITPLSALPTEEITITGRNFNSYLASNNIVNFKGSDVSIAATHVTPDGAMLSVHVPADKESGDCMVSVTTSQGTSNEVPFVVQTLYDGIDRVMSQLIDKMAQLPEGHPAVPHMIAALDLLGQIKDLLDTPNPDTGVIMSKTQETMGHIWDAIELGADTLWDKPYLITAMRATLAKSMIGVEQSYMIYDLMKTIGPNHPSWPYLRSASDGMHFVVSEYMTGSMSRAITAMKNVISALQSAKTVAGGIDTSAIQISLAQSPIHFLSKLKKTLEDAGTEFMDEANTIGVAISTSADQIVTGIYDGALDTLAGVWDHLGSMLGTMCYCVPRFTGEKSGEAMKVSIKYQLYYDNCNGWHIQFAARGNDGAQEVFDTDEMEVKCVGRYIFWSLAEQSIECVSVKPVVVADTVSVDNDQWTFKQDANNQSEPGYIAGVLTSNKRTIADYKAPKLAGDAKSNTDQLTITLKDGRNQVNDSYTNTVTVLIRRPMNFCNENDPADPFNAEGYIFEYADEFSRYRVWLDIPQVNRTNDTVEVTEGCGCEITPSWAVGAAMSTQQSAVVPEYFAVNVPQTFTISDNTDTDDLTVSCQEGYMCLSGAAVKTLPDAIRYAWNLMTGAGAFDYGINSSETSFTASAPSTEEKDFLFLIPAGNTGFEAPETDAAVGKESTVVLVDLIADGINEYDEVYKGACVIVNDNDTNEDGIYDWNQKKVVGIKLDPNKPEKTSDEIDLVPFTMDVRPLIAKIGNYVKLEIILPQTGPESEIKIWEKPTKEKEFTQYLGQEWLIVQVGAGVEMQYLGDDGNWHKVPDVLYIEGRKAGQTARDTQLKLTYVISGNIFCDTVFLNIMDAEIDAPDADDNIEESIGGYIKFNNDDDDKNGIIDLNDNPMAVEDDDLMEYKMEYLPYLHGGVVRLEIMSGGKDILNPGRIQVWNDKKKTMRILPGPNGELFKEWSICADENIPQAVYVEGCDISAIARDSALRITYSAKQKYGEQIGKECEDVVRTTVLLIDADIDSDNDNGSAAPDSTPAEEFIEEDAPGKVFAVDDKILLVIKQIATTDVPKSRQEFRLEKTGTGAGKTRIYRKIADDKWGILIDSDKTQSKNLWDDISKGGMTLLVEGVEPGEFELSLTQTATGLLDMVKGTVTKIDLDVDSDNTRGLYGPPDNNAEEEQIENDPTLPGKILPVALNDSDADGIPDFADGFDRDGIPGTQDDHSTHKLTPLELEIAEPVDLSKAIVKFTYSGSAPSGVDFINGTYIFPAGNIRIWKKNEETVRTVGDYISTGQYIASELGFTALKRTVPFYVEGIETGQTGITADVDINGNVTMISSDAVLVSVIGVDIDIDSDNDNGSGLPEKDTAEDLIEELSPGMIFVLNNDDDDNDQKEDNLDNKINGINDENDMAQIVLHKTSNMPGKQEITITKTGDIRLFNAQTKAEYMKPAEKSKTVSWADITANDIVLLVEGVKNGEFELTLTHTETGLSDKIKGAAGKVNILGYRPGTMAVPGLAIVEQEEDDPLNLIAPVNDDNDDNDPNGRKDNRDFVIGATDNDIVKAVLQNYFPVTLAQGTMELQISHPEAVKIFKADGQSLLQDYTLDLANPAGDLLGMIQADRHVDIYLEGILPVEDAVLTLAYKDSTGAVASSDELHIMIISVDLDMDSDNDNGLDPPEMNDEEDNMENDPTLPGKVIAAAYGDADADGVPDFADGYNLDKKSGTDEQRRDDTSSHKFARMILEIPAFADMKDAEIVFWYDVSPPAEVSRNIISGQYVYAPYAGSLRIWTKDGDKKRNAEPINKKDGDMVYSNVAYKLSDFGWDATKDAIELFVEGIQPSAVIGDKTIEVKLYPKGIKASITGHTDAIRATIVNADLNENKSLRVYDPKLEGSPMAYIKYRIEPQWDYKVSLNVLDNSGNVVAKILDNEQRQGANTDYVENWNGKWGELPNQNKFANTGQYKMKLEVIPETAGTYKYTEEYEIYIVRLGVVEISFEDSGTVNEEYDLMYHFTDSTDTLSGAGNDFPVNGSVWEKNLNFPTTSGDIGDLDKADGTSRENPVYNPNLNFPEQDAMDPDGVEDDNFNRPVCYKMNSKPQVKAKTGLKAVSEISKAEMNAGYQLLDFSIKMLPSGYKSGLGTGNEDIEPGREYAFECINELPGVVCQRDVDIHWRFYYKQNNEWIRIPGEQETKHLFYIILDEPQTPFEGIYSPSSGKQRPWISMLEKICFWANNENSAEGVASKVTQSINDSGRFVYDTAEGATRYAYDGKLDLTACMDRLDGGAGLLIMPPGVLLIGGQYVNCTDCASFVATFSNCAGCNLWSSQIYGASGFYLNEIIPIGYTVWQVPFWGGFGYHEVGWTGNATLSDNVFDACLKVDNDADPTVAPHIPWIPVNIVFDDNVVAPPYKDYREKLAIPGPTGVGNCIAQPSERVKREVK